MFPRFFACDELRALKLILVRLAYVVTAGAQLKHVVDFFSIKTIRVVDVAVWPADGYNLGTQFGSLFCSTPCHISKAGERDGLTLDVNAACGEHVVDEIDGTVAGSLWADARAAIFQALSCEYALKLVLQFLIHTEEVANLTTADTDVACWYVLVRADMTIELCHEGLAETHHLSIATATDREVGTTFSAAHW